jgi:hypothetical protein
MIVDTDDMRRIQPVEQVDFLAVRHLDIPAEAVLKDASPKTKHVVQQRLVLSVVE